nr:MAG TPA: hypothetical protein [Herelleviridae sp.]
MKLLLVRSFFFEVKPQSKLNDCSFSKLLLLQRTIVITANLMAF